MRRKQTFDFGDSKLVIHKFRTSLSRQNEVFHIGTNECKTQFGYFRCLKRELFRMDWVSPIFLEAQTKYFGYFRSYAI